jgi:hypothetical protein
MHVWTMLCDATVTHADISCAGAELSQHSNSGAASAVRVLEQCSIDQKTHRLRSSERGAKHFPARNRVSGHYVLERQWIQRGEH